MVPIWIMTVSLALTAGYVARSTPVREAQSAVISSDVSATNFLGYRRSVLSYLQANPGATGTISDALLASHWITGHVRDARWTNLVSGSTVFIYATAAVPLDLQVAVYKKSGKSVLIGTKNATTGRLVSIQGMDTGINIPSGIPDGSFVMVGR